LIHLPALTVSERGLFPSVHIILSVVGSVGIEKLFICMTIFLEGAEIK